jgi:hypothetical protein
VYDGTVRIAISLVALAIASRAWAGPADDSFERGRALMTQGKVAEACAAFEDSLRLDYQLGTVFNLAACNVQRGKLATALGGYRKIAAEDKNPTRAARSRELADQLAPRVPMLVLAISNLPAGARVTVDGGAVDPAAPIPLDLGAHELSIQAPGRPEVKRSIEAPREGEQVSFAYDMGVPQWSPPPDTKTRRRTGTVVVGAGALTVGAGLVLGTLALRGWQDAEDTAVMDPGQANRDLRGVRRLGNVSTGLVVVGVLTVGAGFYLRW